MNKTLKILYFANSFLVFGGSLLTPLYALFVTKIGGGAELAGILFGVQFISISFTSLFIIKLKDKNLLNTHLLIIGFLTRAFCWLLLVFMQTVPALFTVQIFLGIAEAVATPAFLTLISDHLDREKHIREWGIWEVIKNPLIAIAGGMSGFIVTFFGFSALFAVMSASAFIAATVLIFIPPQGYSTPGVE